jgi:hypothetical protein
MKEVQGPDTTGRRIQGLLFLACWWYMHCKSGSHKNIIRKSSRKTYNLIMGI